MNPEPVTIVITAATKTKKSTIAVLIGDCLQQHGFDVRIDDTLGERPPSYVVTKLHTIKHRLLRLFGKSQIGAGKKVRIEVRQTPRVRLDSSGNMT